MKITFDTWKQQLFRLAKREKLVHRVPGSDDLYGLWERKLTAQEAWEKIKKERRL